MTDNVRNVIIIGSGCSGLTAAIYAARANLSPLVIDGHEPGGQLAITTLVENFPGFPEGIQGPELIDNMRKQAERFGAQFRTGHVVSVDLSQKKEGLGTKPIEVNLGRETLLARALIIASGASARWLDLPNEKALIGHGVSSCATCDGFFFSGKEIAVIGGGDSAMEEAHLPHSICFQGHADSSPQRVSRFEDHARSRPPEREDRVYDRHRG